MSKQKQYKWRLYLHEDGTVASVAYQVNPRLDGRTAAEYTLEECSALNRILKQTAVPTFEEGKTYDQLTAFENQIKARLIDHETIK